MIELTPLDVRKKKGDFTRGLRGYDPREVDQFLGLVAERLEEVVKVNLSLRERVEDLAARVEGQEGRERAVQDALVTAQSLKLDIQEQARRDAERIQKETADNADRVRQESEREAERVRQAAEQKARDLKEKAEHILDAAQATVEEMIAEREQELSEFARRRSRFLERFRMLLEREMEVVQLAEASAPDDGIDLDVLQFGKGASAVGSFSDSSEDPEDEIVVPDDTAPVVAADGGALEEESAESAEDGEPANEIESAGEGDAAPPEAADDADAESSEGSGRGPKGTGSRSRREAVASREAGDGVTGEERWGAR